MHDLQLIQADYHNPQHAADIRRLLNNYACDPMGGGQALPPHVLDNLVPTLATLPHAFSVLCYQSDNAIALATCFESFSTFYCRPILNIHDFMVEKPYRGQGISQQLLGCIEDIACSKNCCKITLEVLSNNTAAKVAYRNFGFEDYALDPAAGHALFWQKVL